MKVYELLAEQLHWTRGFQAVNGNNHQVNPTDPRAVRWSVNDAIRKCYPWRPERDAVTHRLFACLMENGAIYPIAAWNNDRGTSHSNMVALLRKLDI